MARYNQAVCRLCRREGMKLDLKGSRCATDKCAIERRPYASGQHGQRRVKTSGYGTQLREKQKIKRIYGILERQFRGYFTKADRKKGITGENLLIFLERRLDNIVYRMGFSDSRSEARQMVSHGHFLVNGKKVSVPSYLVREGDEVAVREKSQKTKRINESMEAVDRRGVPLWLELDKKKFAGRIKSFPAREELTMPMNEQLVVELYSR
jgi:small subunit ribosomal protein S4